VQEPHDDAAGEPHRRALPAVLGPRWRVELEVQVGTEAAQVELGPELLGKRRAGRLDRDQQAALEVLDPGDVAVQPDRTADVLRQRGAEPRVVPVVGVLAARLHHERVGRMLGMQPRVGSERVARAPREQPRRLARGQRLPLALVLVQHRVAAVAAGAAGVDAGGADPLAAHRLHGPAPDLEHAALGHGA